ncbi:MAG: hypothetical protein JW913_01855 [Chitinispirillaceae bacterium]|nr:hypothetical protein [Chitinispirillaceae bacterium]
MGFFNLKTTLTGLTLIGSVSWLFADAVVDQTFDDNQNEFEYYWYYYDDNSGWGPQDRPTLFPDLKPSVIDVPYTEANREAMGDLTDTYQVKKYTFQPGNSLSKPCATMPFTFGDPWEAGYCTNGNCAVPFVGIGAMLTKEQGAIDLTGVTAITFLIKSRVNTLKEVSVRLQTLDIDKYSFKKTDEYQGDEFGYYGYTFSVTPGDWQPITVNVPDDLVLPGSWAHDFTFDITKCTKLSWEIKGTTDSSITGDTLDIADVTFVGTYVFNSPTMWMNVESAPPASGPTSGLFSTFDNAPYNEGPPRLRYYWYAYNDAEIGGNSAVSPSFAVQDTSTGRLAIKFQPATGSDGVGQGAALEYTLGKPVMKDDTIPILGFVGIGINLYDSAKTKYFNADSASVNSIYFEYFTTGAAKKVTFELSDINDVGDATTPARRDSRGSGIVYYRNFPPTGDVWRRVMIPFDSLIVHDDWEGYTAIPLDKTKLAKAQWKVQGGDGTQGLYAIDNIYMPSGNFGVPIIAADKSLSGRARASSFNASYVNGNVRVNWTGAANLTRGKLSLINPRGVVVSSANAAGGSGSAAYLPSALLPAGIYFVRLNGIDAAGKAVAMRAPITIVK